MESASHTGALGIVLYPHPVLRHKSKPLTRVDAELRQIVGQMFDLMYEANGVGLAANQVGLPYRFFVVNLASDPEAKEEEHVFINPEIHGRKGSAEADEGCLSIPGIYCPVVRPDKVTLSAYNLAGEELHYELDGLFSRVVQHENDHVDGVLFIDRLSQTEQVSVKEELEEFELEFQGKRQRGEIPSDADIAVEIAVLERLRT